MLCPKCGGKTYVTNSIEKKDFVMRYRKCKKCKKTFKTKEMFSNEWIALQVLKSIKKQLNDMEL